MLDAHKVCGNLKTKLFLPPGIVAISPRSDMITGDLSTVTPHTSPNRSDSACFVPYDLPYGMYEFIHIRTCKPPTIRRCCGQGELASCCRARAESATSAAEVLSAEATSDAADVAAVEAAAYPVVELVTQSTTRSPGSRGRPDSGCSAR